MELREKIFEVCDHRIETAKRADCPQDVKENMIKKRQVSKEMLKIVCGIQGMNPYVAKQIFSEAREIIEEAVMKQEI